MNSAKQSQRSSLRLNNRKRRKYIIKQTKLHFDIFDCCIMIPIDILKENVHKSKLIVRFDIGGFKSDSFCDILDLRVIYSPAL